MCGDLADIMNSDKNFVVLSVRNSLDESAGVKVLLDNEAVERSCEREKKKKPKKNSCPETEAEDSDEKIENPVSMVLNQVLPICMG